MVTCTECISAPYFTHVPAQISNSRDSAVVYISYLPIILCVTMGSQFTIPKKHMFCVIVQDPSSLLRYTCSTEET